MDGKLNSCGSVEASADPAPLRDESCGAGRRQRCGALCHLIRATRKPGHDPDGADPGDGLSDFGSQSDKSVSRETFWYDWEPKPYKATYVSRLGIGGIARINRPMCHQNHDQKLSGNPKSFRT
jgi:hypothetical protein